MAKWICDAELEIGRGRGGSMCEDDLKETQIRHSFLCFIQWDG